MDITEQHVHYKGKKPGNEVDPAFTEEKSLFSTVVDNERKTLKKIQAYILKWFSNPLLRKKAFNLIIGRKSVYFRHYWIVALYSYQVGN